MSQAPVSRPYRGGYQVGFLIGGVAAVRILLFFEGPMRLAAVLLLAGFGLLYTLEPAVSARARWFRFVYFPLQAALVLVLSNLRPFLDFSSALWVPLCVQALRAFPRRAAWAWMALFAALLAQTLLAGMGPGPGLSFGLMVLVAGGFLLSYELLYNRTQAARAESQALLAGLEQAHQELKEQAAQAEELAAIRERNRLARDLHDSVSQLIFGITLTSQSARLFLERDPARVPEQLDRLEELTGTALGQLRSLIAQLRPPSSP